VLFEGPIAPSVVHLGVSSLAARITIASGAGGAVGGPPFWANLENDPPFVDVVVVRLPGSPFDFDEQVGASDLRFRVDHLTVAADVVPSRDRGER